MAKEFTALAIEKIKSGPARREIPDGRVGGLYFIIQPSGKRSWAVRYRHAGRPCKFTLGQYPKDRSRGGRQGKSSKARTQAPKRKPPRLPQPSRQK